MECNHANRWQSAWWPSYRCIWRARSYLHRSRAMRARGTYPDRGDLHARHWTRQSGAWMRWRWKRIRIRAKVVSVKPVEEWCGGAAGGGGGGSLGLGDVASTSRAALLAARARISSRAARCIDRFAKPSVMQGVPLPTRGCSRTAGRKSGTRRSGAGARAAATRPADSSEVPPSVVSVSLLERWNCVAQVLRLLRDYFKLDNYRGHEPGPRPGATPGCTYMCRSARAISRCISRVQHT